MARWAAHHGAPDEAARQERSVAVHDVSETPDVILLETGQQPCVKPSPLIPMETS